MSQTSNQNNLPLSNQNFLSPMNNYLTNQPKRIKPLILLMSSRKIMKHSQLTSSSDDKINKLVDELQNALTFSGVTESNSNHNKFEQLYQSSQILHGTIQQQQPSSRVKALTKSKQPIRMKNKKRKLKDDYSTNLQRMENQVEANKVQRQLNDNIRRRALSKSQRNKTEPDEPYLNQYKNFVQNQNEKGFCSGIMKRKYTIPEVSPEGIHYFSSLKDKEAILEHIRSKIKQQELKQKLLLKDKKQYNYFLNQLKRRKKNPSNETIFKIPQKWEMQLYQSQIQNIEEVSSRLKKIYTNRTKYELSQEAREVLNKSPVLKTQRQILDHLNFGNTQEKLSRQNKHQLIKKFSSILRDIARSVPSQRRTPKTQQQKKLQLSIESSKITRNKNIKMQRSLKKNINQKLPRKTEQCSQILLSFDNPQKLK